MNLLDLMVKVGVDDQATSKLGEIGGRAAGIVGGAAKVVAGGVACNSVLRERFEALTPKHVQLRLAARKYCTDNAAMVGGLGWHYHRKQAYSPLNIDSFARLPQITQVPFLGE